MPSPGGIRWRITGGIVLLGVSDRTPAFFLPHTLEPKGGRAGVDFVRTAPRFRAPLQYRGNRLGERSFAGWCVGNEHDDPSIVEKGGIAPSPPTPPSQSPRRATFWPGER